MLSQLVVFSPAVQATSGRAIINNFQNGSTVVIDFSAATGFNEIETFEILENTTIQDAYFSVEYQTNSDSPGEVSMNIVGTSSQSEWSYSGIGYGDIGNQTLFSDGTNSTLINLAANTQTAGPSFFVPTDANIVNSSISHSFYPENEGLWNELGQIEDIIIADIDGDGLEEPVFLDITGTIPRIGWIDYQPSSTNYSSISWKDTCPEAKNLTYGDFNNDSRDDIVSFGTTASGQGVICIHFTNTVTTLNNYFYLGSHAFSGSGEIVDVEITDITYDGYDDIIWANKTSIGYTAYNPLPTAVDPFTFEVVKGITVNGGLTGSELTVIESIAVGNYDGPNSNLSVAVGDVNEWVSLHQLRNNIEWEASSMGALRCGGQDLVSVDLNGDTFDDILGWTNESSTAPQASCSYLKNPSTYQFYYNSTSYFSPEGSGLGDINADGMIDLFVLQYIDSADIDGDEMTLEGGIEQLNLDSSDTFSLSMLNVTPRTNPTNIKLGDLDGDGKDEMILLSGESELGLFIDTLHQINIDLNNDGIADAQSMGFTRDQIGNGTQPIVSDFSQLSPALITSMPSYSSTTDSYEIQMSTVDTTISSLTAGEVELSNLFVLYDIIFRVESYPGLVGNISNLLNSAMTTGTGNIPVDLSFNSTKQGSISITDLVVDYTLGAPPQPPTTPLVLSLTSKSWNSVDIGWVQISPTQDTFIEYTVLRSDTNDTSNLIEQVDISDINLSRYTDLNVVENKTYWYAVIAKFDYGHQTPMSNLLEVYVPSSYEVTGVTAIDQPEDSGGALLVSWNTAVSTAVNGYDIYVSDYNFSDVSNLGSSVTLASTYNQYLVTLTSEKYDNSGNELEPTGPIPDGVALWVAVVAVEASGTSNPLVTATGPIYSLNNMPMATSIDIKLLDDDGDEINPPVISASTPFSIQASLSGEGTPISDAPVTITISQPGVSSNSISYPNLTTNEMGTVEQFIDWADHIHLLLMNSFGGDVIISAEYEGVAGTPMTREQLAIASSLDSATIEVGGQFFVQGGNAWSVEQDGGINLEVKLLANNQDEQSLFEELDVKWISSKDGNTVSGGTVELDAFGKTTIEISNMAQGGEIEIWIDTEEDLEDWMKLDTTSITVSLSQYQDGGGSLDSDSDGVVGDADLCPATSFEERNDVDENGCGPSEQPQTLLAPELSCEGNWEIPNSPDQPTTSVVCTFTNTNSVYVSLSIEEWEVSDGMSIDISCPYLPMALGPAGGTISSSTCTFYPTISEDIPKSVDSSVASTLSFNASVQNAGGAGAGGYLDAIVSYDMNYNLIGPIYIPTNASITDSDNTGTNQSQNSDVSSLNIDVMKYAPIAGGVVIGLLLLIIIISLIRRRGNDDDDDDYEDDYGLFDEGPGPSPGGLDNLLQGARPLITGASGRDQGRSMGKQMPTVGREMGRSAESEPSYEETYETTEEGYSVDEEGTEWWEDDNGQWWYRTVDMEDWDAWNE